MRRPFQSSFAQKSDDSADNVPDLLKSLYDKLWSNIWNKENRVWTFLAFYSAGIALALNSGLLTQFGLLAPFIVVQLTAWGVQIIIDGDWWSIRNRLMVEQIERRYSQQFTAVVPSKYQEPRFSSDSLYRFSIVVLVVLGGAVFQMTVLRYAAPHWIHNWDELIGILGLVLLALIHIAIFLSIRETQIDSYYQLFSELRADEERIRPPLPRDRPIVPLDAIRASHLASRRAQRMRWIAVFLAIIVFGTVDWVVGSQPGLRILFLWIGIAAQVIAVGCLVLQTREYYRWSGHDPTYNFQTAFKLAWQRPRSPNGPSRRLVWGMVFGTGLSLLTFCFSPTLLLPPGQQSIESYSSRVFDFTR